MKKIFQGSLDAALQINKRETRYIHTALLSKQTNKLKKKGKPQIIAKLVWHERIFTNM